MDEIKTWADFGALSKEEVDALSPEDLEALKTSISANEAKLAEDRKKADEDFKKTKELADNYKIRAEKAEKAKKGEGEQPKDSLKEEASLLSQKDIIHLIKGNVHEDDIDDVLEYATFKKISVTDALKSSTIKSILAEKAEQRKSAEATNTGKPRPGSKKPTDGEVLEKARAGEIPDKDSEAAEQLFWARRGRKRE